MGRYGRLGLFGRINKADKEAAVQALSMVGMLPFAKRQISELSGGQQQRLFIARALVQKCRYSSLDEPFAGVDMATEKRSSLFLKEQRQAKKQSLSTITIFQLYRLFEWTVLLNTRLIACGPTKEVFLSENLQKTFGKGQMLFDEAADSLAKKKKRNTMIEFFTDPVLRGPTWGTLLCALQRL